MVAFSVHFVTHLLCPASFSIDPFNAHIGQVILLANMMRLGIVRHSALQELHTSKRCIGESVVTICKKGLLLMYVDL